MFVTLMCRAGAVLVVFVLLALLARHHFVWSHWKSGALNLTRRAIASVVTVGCICAPATATLVAPHRLFGPAPSSLDLVAGIAVSAACWFLIRMAERSQRATFERRHHRTPEQKRGIRL